MDSLPLVGVLPDFAAETALHGGSEPDLAGQITNLAIIHRCRCGEGHCASVYVADGRTGTRRAVEPHRRGRHR